MDQESPGIRSVNFDPARPHLSILFTTGDSVHTGPALGKMKVVELVFPSILDQRRVDMRNSTKRLEALIGRLYTRFSTPKSV